MELDPVAKGLMIVGGVLITLGIFWQMGWLQSLKLGHLPGDIYIEKENFRFYFPITTGILISAVLTFLSWLFQK